MDLSFFRRAEQRFAAAAPASLDFGMFVAMLRTQQAAAPASASVTRPAAAPGMDAPIAEILAGGASWREAVAAQGGCFNPDYVRQGPVN
ncbi:MAG TPA: hypothetical protein VGB59_01365 [Allosphingosinicella sp.]|jgi:hypothetical protein